MDPDRKRRPERAVLLALACLVALFVLGLAVLQALEGRLERRLVREAAARGIELRLERVRLSPFGRLSLEGVDAIAPRAPGLRVTASRVVAFLRPRLASPRTWICVRTERLAAALPPGVAAGFDDRVWRVRELSRTAVAVEQREGGGLLAARVELAPRPHLEVRLHGYALGRLVRLSRGGEPLADLGTVHGVAIVDQSGDGFGVDAVARGTALRLATLDEQDESSFGAPMNYDAAVTAHVVPGAGRVDVTCAQLTTSGVSMSAAGSLQAGADDIGADLTLDVPRVELSKVLAASGLPLAGLEPIPADLGWASLVASVRGHLRDPESIEVDEKLDFSPPDGGVPALRYLAGPFTHTAVSQDAETRVEVRPGAPSFIPFADVPPLFVRALTIAEDAAFWGHPGIDLKEIPVALATNWVRGEKARGASTITQQLVKNLFLSRQKSYARKLQEVALTLLVESVLSKGRILEIYLNVIEWGPGVFGLRPAARHYFAKEPQELTPKEMAFLVCLIPGPIKYQRSIAGGTVSPRFHALVVSLLAKLRSVGALTDEEYEAEKAAPIVLRRPGDAPPPVGAGEELAGPPAEVEGPPAPAEPAEGPVEPPPAPTGSPAPTPSDS